MSRNVIQYITFTLRIKKRDNYYKEAISNTQTETY